MPSSSNGSDSASKAERENYILVGWDMDATGRKLFDEICQIAGYTPDKSYSQYVMPYRNLNPSAKKRHALKIITITRYRMLKDIKANKILATKSEISALTEFLDWLGEIKGDSKGVILVYHEHQKVLPSMLLESLERWKLLDRFEKIVTGFVNGCDIVKKRNKNSNDAFSMRSLSRALLNKEEPKEGDDNLNSATHRAQVALQIFLKLAEKMWKSVENGEESEVRQEPCDPLELARENMDTVEEELKKHKELQIIVKRENALKPIFASIFYRTKRERQQANPLRRLLAIADIEYLHLQEAWNNEKLVAIGALIKEKIPEISEKDLAALLQIVEIHFDEEKAQNAKREREEFSAKRLSEKKAQRGKKSHGSSHNNADSGNESADAALAQSPTSGPAAESDNSAVAPEVAVQ